jgi:hypothetical protein
MKKLLVLLGVLVISHGVFAQDSLKAIQDTPISKISLMKKDCYLMKDGKMMMLKHGDTTMMMAMDTSVILNNGATVMTDGTVKMVDGTTKMLKEGWYVDMDGKIGKMKKAMDDDKK